MASCDESTGVDQSATVRSSLPIAAAFEALESRLLLDGTLEGTVWQDLSADGLRDVGEAGLNGWVVELVDHASDTVVATQTTAGIDLSGDGVVDPETESGAYRFTGLAQGNYIVRHVAQATWSQSTTHNPGLGQAGAEFKVNTTTSNSQGSPSLAMSDTGDFVVVWEDHAIDGISGQLYHVDGTPRGGEFQINVQPQAETPSVSVDATGDFVVTWAAEAADRTGRDVKARLFNADGTPKGDEFLVNTYTTQSQDNPVVALTPTGEFVIAWQSYGQDGHYRNSIYAQRYDAAGTPQGGEFHVNTYSLWSQSSPDVAIAASGDFVIVWDSEYQDESGIGVFAQAYHADATPRGGEFQVHTRISGDQADPSIAIGPDGDFLVAWMGHEPSNSKHSISARSFRADLTPRGAEFYVSTVSLASRDTGLPSVAVGQGGGFVVGWQGQGVRARILQADGTPVGDELLIALDSTTTPKIAMSPGGEVLAVWSRYGSGQDDVYGRLIPGYADNDYQAVTLEQDQSVTMEAFGVYQAMSVSGQVFEDVDRDSLRGFGETGADGWAVELVDVDSSEVIARTVTVGWDVDDNGVIDAASETGLYSFQDVVPGSYDIRLVLPERWAVTTPRLARRVTLISGQDQAGRDIGVARLSSIGGQTFEDFNGDALRDPGDVGVDGWTIELVDLATGRVVATQVTAPLDVDDNGQIDSESEAGRYRFADLAPGSYAVRQATRAGWEGTTPVGAVHTVAPGYGEDVSDVAFGSEALVGQITGRKYHDLDGDGLQGPAEPGLDGWTVELVDPDTGAVLATQVTASRDIDGDGQIDPAGERGWYAFTDLAHGEYHVREVAQGGWSPRVAATEGPGQVTQATLLDGDGYSSSPLRLAVNASGRGVAVWRTEIGSRTVLLNADGTQDGERITVWGTPMGMADSGDFVTAGLYTYDTYQVRTYHADGRPKGEVFEIEADDEFAVAVAGSGAFVVGGSLGGPAFSIQRCAADASAVGDLITVVRSGGTQYADLSLVIYDDGDFLALWQSLGSDGDNWGVFAQRFHADGTLDGEVQQVNTTSIGRQFRLRGASDAAGNTLLAWVGHNPATGGEDAFIRLYDASGTPKGPERPIMSLDGRRVWSFDALAMDARGRSVVGWYDGGSQSIAEGVYAQLINADGTPNGSTFDVALVGQDGLMEISSRFDLAIDDSGRVTVMYQGQRGYYGYYEVHTKQFAGFSDDGRQVVDLDAGAAAQVHWGSYQVATITGHVFEDLDAGGSRDPGEWGLDGWTVELVSASTGAVWMTATTTSRDVDGNGVIDPVIETGLYRIDGVLPGDYVVRHVVQDTFGTTLPLELTHALSLSSGQVRTDVDFGDTRRGAVSGQTFHDVDGDGVRGPGELGLDGRTMELVDPVTNAVVASTVTVSVDVDGDGVIDPATESGLYTFDRVEPGSYEVWEMLADGWGLSLPQADSTSGMGQGVSIEADAAMDSAVAMSATGRSVVVWSELRDNGISGLGVFGRRVDARGRPEGEVFRVTTDVSGVSWVPDVAMNDAGEFVVTWVSPGWNGESSLEILGRKYHADGTPMGDVFHVNTYSPGRQYAPRVALNTAGRAVIAWESELQDGEGYGVYARMVNADGTLDGGEFQVNTHTANNQDTCDVAMDAAGRFTVTWESYEQDGQAEGVYAQRYAADGTPDGSEFRVSTTTAGEQKLPSIAMASDGGSVISWAGGGRMTVQRYDPAGLPVGDETETDDVNTRIAPSVAMDDAGRFAVACSRVQFFNADGTPTGQWLNLPANWVNNTISLGMDNFGRAVISSQRNDAYTLRFLAYRAEHTYSAVIGQAETIDGLDFGNYEVIDISGQAFEDANLDQHRGPGEVGLDGWTVELVTVDGGTTPATRITASVDLNGDGAIDPETESGLYAFEGVAPGNYVVRRVRQDGWHESLPMSGNHRFWAESDDAFEGVNFGSVRELAVSGQAFDDVDGNALRGAGEAGLDGWTIELLDAATNSLLASVVTAAADLNGDGAIDPVTETGLYTFASLLPGDYIVRQIAQVGFSPMAPPSGYHALTLVASDVTGVEFGTLVNHVPLADDFQGVFIPGLTFTGQLTASDEEGQPLTFAIVDAPAHGQLTQFDPQSGVFTYLPADDFVGSHTFTFVARDAWAESAVATAVVHFIPAFQGTDIGPVGLAGSITVEGSVFTVEGSGNDIGNSRDEFYYAYRTLSGDGEIIARVVSVGGTHNKAEAGVMIRETFDAASAYALISVTSREGVAFKRRYETDTVSTNTYSGSTRAPYWVKLVRQGDTLTGYRSADGQTWQQVGSDTVAMADDVYVGLVVSSYHNGRLCNSEFDNVQITGRALGAAGVSGQVFNDVTGDGFHDAGETGLDGRTVELLYASTGMVVAATTTAGVDVDGNGTIDPQTEAGRYAFTDLMPGRYEVRLADHTGWGQSTPAETHTVTLSAVQGVTDMDFGSALTASVTGRAFEDANANALRDAGEVGLDGRTVEVVDPATGLVLRQTLTVGIDLDGNGTIDPESETGLYAFDGLLPGPYHIRMVPQHGWGVTLPMDATHSLTLTQGQVVDDVDFANHALAGDIRGQKFHDANANGLHDVGEVGLNGWTIELVDPISGTVLDTQVTAGYDLDGDGLINADYESGLYAFAGLTDGVAYLVREVAQAGWNVGPMTYSGLAKPSGEIIANSHTAGDQHSSVVAMDKAGNTIVAWTDHGFGQVRDVHAQRYYADGSANGNEFIVNTETDGSQHAVAAVMADDGRSVVVWTSSDRDGEDDGIFAQRYAADGTPAGPELQVNTHTVDVGWTPVVAMNAAGQFVVVWISPNQGGTAEDIFAQKYAPDGTPDGPEFQVNTTGDGRQYQPSAAIDATGAVVVTWTSAEGEIHARLYAPDGLARGDEFQINTTTDNDQMLSVVASGADGNFVVAWSSRNQDGNDLGVFAQRCSPAGLPVGEEFQVNTHTARDQYHSSIAMDSRGGFVIVWTSRRQDGDAEGIFARAYGPDGTSLGDEMQINVVTARAQQASSVAMSDSGEVVVVWETESPWSDIALRRFTFIPADGVYQVVPNVRHAIWDVDFGGYQPVSISGQTFEDLTVDGAHDPGELGLDGRAIELLDPATGQVLATTVTAGRDVDGNGVIDPETEAGSYVFDGLVPGSYEVRQVAQAGWLQTAPATTHAVVPLSGDDVRGDFGNARLGRISGGAYNDVNGDGIRAADDPVLTRWDVELVDAGTGTVLAVAETTSVDLDGDGQIDPQTERGRYVFEDLQPGSYVVRSESRPGWAPTAPASGQYAVVLGPGQQADEREFGIRILPRQIAGQKFHDVNGDGVHDADEPGLDGWTIELVDPASGAVLATQVTASIDVDDNGVIDPVTEAGLYAFEDVPLGTYTVREVARSGWVQSAPQTNYSGGYVLNQPHFNAEPESDYAYDARVAIGPDGSFLTVWIARDMTVGGPRCVFGRFTNAQGVVSEAFRLTGDDVHPQKGPAVALLANGEFVVTWSQYTSGTVQSVLGRRISPAGLPVGGVFSIASGRDYSGGNGTLAQATSDGGFVVAWNSKGASAAQSPLQARLYHADATPRGGQFLVAAETFDDDNPPRVSAGDNGNIVFVWARVHVNSLLVEGRVYQADGTVVTGVLQLDETTSGAEPAPQVAMGPDGRFAMVWKKWLATESMMAPHVRFFNADGTPAGDDVIVTMEDGHYHYSPTIATTDSSQFVVLWVAGRKSGSYKYWLKGQFYQSDGTPHGADFTATSQMHGRQSYAKPMVAMNDSGQLVTAWVDYGADEYYIYAIRLPGLSDDGMYLNVAMGPSLTDMDFGNYMPATIVGHVWQDPNLNGQRDAGETGLDGWAVELVSPADGRVMGRQTTTSVDLNGDGQIDPATEMGIYTFSGLTPGRQYFVRQIQQDNWAPTTPMTSQATTASSGQVAVANFGNQSNPGSISGQKFHDVNANGVRDAGETGLDGWTIERVDAHTGLVVATAVTGQVDLDGDGTIDPATEMGLYTFTGLVPKNHVVREVLPAGWIQTTPPPGALGPMADGFQVNTHTTGNQLYSRVATGQSGESVIVWMSEHPDGDGPGIYAQRYHADGTPNGGEFLVSEGAARAWKDPALAMNASGQFVVMWTRSSVENGEQSIHGRCFGADGLPLGVEFQTNTYTDGHQSQSAVAINGDGSFVVTWQSTHQDGYGGGIFARRYHAGGLPAGEEFRVNSHVIGDQRGPRIAADGFGRTVIVWGSDDQDGYDFGVYAQLYHADGSPDGGEFRVNTHTDRSQNGPEVAMTDDGRFVVVWHSAHVSGEAGIYGQMYDPHGVPVDGEFRIDTTAAGDSVYGASGIDFDRSGRFVVTWGGYSSGSRLFARMFDAGRSPMGDVYDIAPTTKFSLSTPDVAVDGRGRFFVSWYDGGRDGDGYGVFARRFTGFDAASHLLKVEPGQAYDGLDFGICQPTSIAGQVFEDINLNGQRDAGDIALDDWRIALVDPATDALLATRTTFSMDVNGDGTVDPATESGLYSFEGLTPGQYVLRDLADASWIRVAPGPDHAVTLAGGETVTGLDFARARGADLSGALFEDVNGNALRDAAEHGLAGWTVELLEAGTDTVVASTATESLDLNGDGQIDSATESGRYTFIAQRPGNYALRLITPGGWAQTAPAARVHTVSSDYAQSLADLDFAAQAALGQIVGQKFDDANGNGVRDAGETGLDGWTISLLNVDTGRTLVPQVTASVDVNGDGTIDPETETGLYAFIDLPWGNYAVGQTQRQGWQAAAPAGLNATAIGGEFRVNTFTDYDQSEPTVAMAADGSFVTAWTSYGQDLNNKGIYAQRYHADGTPNGAEFRVNSRADDAQASPVVAMNATGQFVIAWQSNHADGNRYGICAQRYNADGTRNGHEIQVNTFTYRDQDKPSVAIDAVGGFLIAWTSENQIYNLDDVFAQRFGPDGQRLGEEFQVNTDVLVFQHSVALAMNASGHAVATWTSNGPDGHDYNIAAQMFNPDGTLNGGEFTVNSTVLYPQTESAVAMTDSGAFTVVWTSANQDSSGNGVYGQRFEPDGRRQGQEFAVNSYVQSYQDVAALAMAPNGTVVVAWESSGQDGSADGVFAQVFGPDGRAAGPEFQVNEQADHTQRAAAVALNADGQTVIVWNSNADAADGVDVYARRYLTVPVRTVPLSAGQTATVNLAQYLSASIAGRLWHDADGNGLRDPGEQALAGQVVFLDADGDGLLSEGERWLVTDAAGAYRFTHVAPGEHAVRHVLPDGWVHTTASPDVQLAGGQDAAAVDLASRALPVLIWDGSDGADWTSDHWTLGPLSPGGGEAMVVNSGTVVVSSDLTVTPGAAASLAIAGDTPGGTVSIAADGKLAVSGAVSVGTGGALRIDGVLAASAVNVTGGRLGNSPNTAAELRIEGDVSLLDGATLAADAVAARLDTLVTSGTVMLGEASSLEIVVSGGGNAFRAGTYTLIQAGGGLSGTFANVTVPTGYVSVNGNGLAYDYDAGTVTLTLDMDLNPGDGNLDGATDVGDRIVWNNYNFTEGTTFITGDYNNDGATDVADRIIWNNHLFTEATVTQPAQAPVAVLVAHAPADSAAGADPDAHEMSAIAAGTASLSAEPVRAPLTPSVEDGRIAPASLVSIPTTALALPAAIMASSSQNQPTQVGPTITVPIDVVATELEPALDAGLVDILGRS